MFSKKTVYNRNSRTSFQKELDAKLKERRSGGYGTGFSDDEAVIDDGLNINSILFLRTYLQNFCLSLHKISVN